MLIWNLLVLFWIKKCLFINSLAFLNFCLANNLNYFRTVFSKIAKISSPVFPEIWNILGVAYWSFYDKVIFFSFFTIMFRLSVINPSISLRILIYSRGSSCGNPITGEANLFLILSPISPFHCWSSIITEILLTFPVVFEWRQCFPFTGKQKTEIRIKKWDLLHSDCIME
jgi:hypothetical protein